MKNLFSSALTLIASLIGLSKPKGRRKIRSGVTLSVEGLESRVLPTVVITTAEGPWALSPEPDFSGNYYWSPLFTDDGPHTPGEPVKISIKKNNLHHPDFINEIAQVNNDISSLTQPHIIDVAFDGGGATIHGFNLHTMPPNVTQEVVDGVLSSAVLSATTLTGDKVVDGYFKGMAQRVIGGTFPQATLEQALIRYGINPSSLVKFNNNVAPPSANIPSISEDPLGHLIAKITDANLDSQPSPPALIAAFEQNQGIFDGSLREYTDDKDSFIVQRDEGLPGHEYLSLNYIGETSLSTTESFQRFEANFGNVFPWIGAYNSAQPTLSPYDRDNSVQLGKRFNLNLPAVTEQLPRLLRTALLPVVKFPGGPPVQVTAVTDTSFTVQTEDWHPLNGTVVHGLVKDANGELWMYQYGVGTDGNQTEVVERVRRELNYFFADEMWQQMSSNFANLIQRPPAWTTFDAARAQLERMFSSDGTSTTLARYKNNWVQGYSDVLQAEATRNNLPAWMLGSVAWTEVGGDPPVLDQLAFWGRFALQTQPEVPHLWGEYSFDTPDVELANLTSFGPIQMQVRRAAVELDKDPNSLTFRDRVEITEKLIDPETNIALAASHLGRIRDQVAPGKTADQLTNDEIRIIASKYNIGLERSNQDALSNSYGQAVLNKRDQISGLLGDSSSSMHNTDLTVAPFTWEINGEIWQLSDGLPGSDPNDRTLYLVHPNSRSTYGNNNHNFILGIDQIQNISGGAGNDFLVGLSGSDWLSGDEGNDYIDGGAGFDWATFVSATTGLTVDLAAGRATGISSDVDTLRNIEGIQASHYNDFLYGNEVRNAFRGLQGDDYIDGRGGLDLVSFLDSHTAVTVLLPEGIATGNGTDILLNIEDVHGSKYSDTILGDSFANVLSGGDGSDGLHGGDGNDTLIGGTGTNYLWGDGGSDRFVFHADYGGKTDIVWDFESNDLNEKIDLTAFGLTSDDWGGGANSGRIFMGRKRIPAYNQQGVPEDYDSVFIAVARDEAVFSHATSFTDSNFQFIHFIDMPWGSIQSEHLIYDVDSEPESDNSLSSLPWQTFGGTWQVSSDGSLSSNDPYSSAVVPVSSSDYTASLQVQSTAVGSSNWEVTRVVFRYQGADNYYALVPNQNGVLELAKMQNGQWTSWLASASTGIDPREAQKYSVKVAGGEIEVFVDGLGVISYTDPDPIATGGVGVINHASEGIVGDVAITPITSPSTDDRTAVPPDAFSGSWRQSEGRIVSSEPYGASVADVPFADYTASVRLQSTAVGDAAWNVTRVVFRHQDANNYYAIVPNADGTLELAKMQNGQWVSWLASAQADIDPMQAHDYQVKVVGGRIEVFVDGVFQLSYTDSDPITSGGIGVINDASAGVAENFSVTKL